MIDRACRVTGLAAAVLLALAAGGCKDKPAGQAAVGKDAATVAGALDGGAAGSGAGVGSGPGVGSGLGSGVDGEGPDEVTLRAGKRTGLGGPDEKPEVATEELIEALAAGTVPWSRFVEPSLGVVELALPASGGPVHRRCGAELTARLDVLTAAMKGASASELGYVLDCDNLGLFTVDGGGARPSAVCSLESPASGTLVIDLVFVPDAARGLRLVGVSTFPSETDPSAVLPDFETMMAQGDQRCP